MSTTLFVTIAAILAIVAVVAVLRRHRLATLAQPRPAQRQLADSGWFSAVGSAFVDDRPAREARYRTAHEQAGDLGPLVSRLSERLDRRWRDSSSDIATGLAESSNAAVTELRTVLDARDRGIDRLTIVLFGRTKAGKSSLYSALSDCGFDGIGDGRQNFTRDVRAVDLEHVRLIDAPGVDGVGSAALEAITTDAINEADLLIVAVTDDAIFEEDFRRLKTLGGSSRPYIVALNVKQANIDRLLEQPELVFRERDLVPYTERIKSALPGAQGDVAPIVAYHALAAERARRVKARRPQVAQWEASRIRELIDAVVSESRNAVSFARTSCDEAVQDARNVLADVHGQAIEATDVRAATLTTAKSEIEGILREVAARERVAKERIAAHYGEAEEQLLEALEIPDAGLFLRETEAILDTGALAIILEREVEESVAAMQEKVADFRAEIELVSRLDGLDDSLVGLHTDFQSHRANVETLTKAAKRRRVLRIGAKAVVGVGAVLATETVVGVAVVGAAGNEAVNRLLPKIEIPPDGRDERAKHVRVAVETATAYAVDVFRRTLDARALEPARVQLVEPLVVELDDLARLRTIAVLSAQSVAGPTPGKPGHRNYPSTHPDATGGITS
ncbi:MAG TPA: 50S ribosome-binding GTPase [Baekduia sp.]|nr:50S ribosome-binding GTPase [Baekduia sp.]